MALCPGLPGWAGTRKENHLDFTEARGSEWQWNQLGHMQVCTLRQTDIHTSTSPLSFYRLDALPATQPTASKPRRQNCTLIVSRLQTALVSRIHVGRSRRSVSTSSSSSKSAKSPSPFSVLRLILSADRFFVNLKTQIDSWYHKTVSTRYSQTSSGYRLSG